MTSKRYVSFSLYGDKDIYNCGAVENAKLIPKVLPGWRATFFLGVSVSESLERKLQSLGAMTLRINESETPIAMTWRFRAAYLDEVSHILFRDCDSRITKREVSCIQQWLNSGKSYHIIRDHPWHASPIMGGLWGVSGSSEIEYIRSMLNGNLLDFVDDYGLDQKLVSEYVYPRAIEFGNYFVHDAFRSRERGRMRPPPRKEGAFMGERILCDGSHNQADRQVVISHENSWLRRLALVLNDALFLLNQLRSKK